MVVWSVLVWVMGNNNGHVRPLSPPMVVWWWSVLMWVVGNNNGHVRPLSPPMVVWWWSVLVWVMGNNNGHVRPLLLPMLVWSVLVVAGCRLGLGPASRVINIVASYQQNVRFFGVRYCGIGEKCVSLQPFWYMQKG